MAQTSKHTEVAEHFKSTIAKIPHVKEYRQLDIFVIQERKKIQKCDVCVATDFRYDQLPWCRCFAASRTQIFASQPTNSVKNIEIEWDRRLISSPDNIGSNHYSVKLVMFRMQLIFVLHGTWGGPCTVTFLVMHYIFGGDSEKGRWDWLCSCDWTTMITELAITILKKAYH